MNASKMMIRMTTTTQKKNTMMPGMAYPATVLALATNGSYPAPRDLFGAETHWQSDVCPNRCAARQVPPAHDARGAQRGADHGCTTRSCTVACDDTTLIAQAECSSAAWMFAGRDPGYL
jgi:hypothetical protein